MSQISIQTLEGDASFTAYRAIPQGEAKAAIVVIQEIFGVNAGIRAKCDKLAAQGYLAIAPDIFWRVQPNVDLDPDAPEQFQQGLDMIGKYSEDLAIRDIEATIRYARSETGGGKVGAVGYCLGGRLAFLSACRTDVDAAVGYYGVGIDGLLHESKAIGKPVLLHVPTADGFVPAAAQKAMHEGLDDNPHVTLIDYEGLDHGFATELGKRRDDAGAKKADDATTAFFAKHLA